MKNKKLLVLSLAALMTLSITTVSCGNKKNGSNSNNSQIVETETDQEKVERVKGEIGPNYQSLASGVKRDFDLIKELDGVKLTYSFSTERVSVSEDGTRAVVNSVYYGDPIPNGEGVVTDEWSESLVMTVTLTCGEATDTKKFNVKILPCARVMNYADYMKVANNGAACVQVIIDEIAYETKYNYNIAWGHDKEGNSYYFYNFDKKYLTDTKIAVGNEVIISGTKSIYSGYHELIKFDAVELVEQNSSSTIALKDITEDVKNASSLSDESLVKYAAAPVKVTDLVIKSITSIDENNYITASESVKHNYLDKVYIKGTLGDKPLTIEISRHMDGAAGKAKLESLSVNDKITVEGRGSWYNGFQVTALDADKIVKTGVNEVSDADKLLAAKEEAEAKLPTTGVTEDFVLPVTTTAYNATIAWTVTGEGATLDSDGKTVKVNRTSVDQEITLNGTVSISGVSETTTITKKVVIAKKTSSALLDIRAELQTASSGTVTASEYTTYGQVTAVDGNTFYYDDGFSSMMVYGGKNNYKVAVGDNVKVVATFTNYNGLIETKNVTSVEKIEDVYTPRTATVIAEEADFTKDKLLGQDNRLVSFTPKLKFKEEKQAYVSGSKDGRYVFTLGSTDVTVSISRFNADVTNIVDLIKSLNAGDEVTITNAILGWFKGPQVTLTSQGQIAKSI